MNSNPRPIKVRLPPSFAERTQDNSWTPTPKDWLYGTWNMTHTSQNYYYARTTNLKIQYAPVLNGCWPCANQELVTLHPITQPTRVYTAYGIDTPISGLDDAWLVECTGHLSHISDHVAFLGWGSDVNNVDWLVMYSTPLTGATTGLPAQVAIMCRAAKELDPKTVDTIKEALCGLGDSRLKEMVDNMHLLAHDNEALLGGQAVCCGYEVVQNVDSLTRF